MLRAIKYVLSYGYIDSCLETLRPAAQQMCMGFGFLKLPGCAREPRLPARESSLACLRAFIQFRAPAARNQLFHNFFHLLLSFSLLLKEGFEH